MTPNTIIIFVAFLLIIGILSFVMAIINWVKLGATSSAIDQLQSDIEKKTHEFDLIRTEANNKRLLRDNEKPSISTTQAMQQPQQSQDNKGSSDNANESINVVRNVRNEYNEISADEPELSVPVVAENEFQNESNDIMAVIGEEDMEQLNANAKSSLISIPIYSNQTKDADFSRLESSIVSIIQKNKSPNISIDFNNVLFFYEEEAQILQKIQLMVEQSGGTLCFNNCGLELTMILEKKPLLAGLIQND